ncbi:retrovirus-related Pol polyprotein from transposon 412 [Trichonephila clavipes]|uniref:Retrovirus-related Pol polyprotein from transposon 412 n=1 Tax=Trichonephila clavipes TaxID=2585209 RepID=A0A8X6SLD7_TRICX|nr:retrovirus-related Pol polyprotein from transposon 412 [Trichonephila clavipes]
MADIQDLKSALLYALKLEAATQASRRDRQYKRGARVTADTPFESPWKSDIEKLRDDFLASMDQRQNQEKGNFKCWGCGRTGHLRINCPRSRKEGNIVSSSKQGNKYMAISRGGADITDPCILGLDFLKNNNFKLDFENSNIHSKFEDITIFGLETQFESDQKIIAKITISLSPRTECIIPGLVAENRNFRLGLIDYPDPESLKAGVLIASSVVDLSNSVIPVRIANISDKTKTIQEGRGNSSVCSCQLCRSKVQWPRPLFRESS